MSQKSNQPGKGPELEAEILGDEPQSLPLMTGVARAEDLPQADDGLLAEPTRGNLPGRGALLVLALLVLAAGALYTMRLTQSDLSTSKSAKEVEAKVERALAKLSQPSTMAKDDPLAKGNIDALFKDTDAVISLLGADPSERQVPLEFVQKNPFTLPFVRVDPVGPAADAPKAAAPTLATADRNADARRLETELKDLKLQTVMPTGRVALAIISGQLVQAGDSVGSFKVKSISGRSVDLEALGQVYSMSMDDAKGAADPSARPRK